MKLALTMGIALLLVGGCGPSNKPGTADLAATPAMPGAADKTDEAARAAKLGSAAEAESGYGRCLAVKATNTLYGGPKTDDVNAVIEWLVTSAENNCTAEFSKFTASLRANAAAYHVGGGQGTDADIKATIHMELVKALRHTMGLSNEPSTLFPPLEQPQAL
ncbi:MAG TPA: hypothetical protein VGQ19_06610 [Burkholderiales bacterium]|jgi:hypothetical protein|nr:hypothetical protein [Burkholderiales bacterium]